MFKISRKTIVISAMVVLLLVTGLLNWKYVIANKEDGEQTSVPGQADGGEVETSNFFTTYKSERPREFLTALWLCMWIPTKRKQRPAEHCLK